MKLIILDRDGTINEDRDDYVKSADEWVPLPGALEAIARLNHAGWHVVVATNQSGLGRGLFDMAALNAMHTKLNRLLATHGGRVDAVFFCPHAPDDACECRKPQDGLLRRAAADLGVDLREAWMVGDILDDIEAGNRAGCRTVLVDRGHETEWRLASLRRPTATVRRLDEAAEVILDAVPRRAIA